MLSISSCSQGEISARGSTSLSWRRERCCPAYGASWPARRRRPGQRAPRLSLRRRTLAAISATTPLPPVFGEGGRATRWQLSSRVSALARNGEPNPAEGETHDGRCDTHRSHARRLPKCFAIDENGSDGSRSRRAKPTGTRSRKSDCVRMSGTEAAEPLRSLGKRTQMPLARFEPPHPGTSIAPQRK